MKTKILLLIFALLIMLGININLQAQYTLTVTHDTTICQGQQVQLNVSGGTTYTWSPSTSLSSTTIANPVATPAQTTKYIVTSQITTGNLAVNGNFSAGNTGFTTHYVYEQYYDTLGPQHYTVGNSPNTWNTGYSNFCTPRGGDANMFIGDGSMIADVPTWCQTIQAYPNSTYTFSGYFQALDQTNLPNMQWMVNNVLVGSASVTPALECTWKPVTATWNSGTTNTLITVCVADNLAGPASGDDFALDDMSITAVITLTDTVTVTVVSAPQVNLGNDTTVCTGHTVTLNATTASSTYLWNTGATTPTISVNSPGTYSVQVNNGCTAKDTIVVAYATAPAAFSLGNDTSYCGNFSRVLTTGNANTVWSTAATGPQIAINTGGTYWATETNQCGATADTIVVTQKALPVVNLGNDTTLCTGQSLTLNATYPASTYLWSNNATTPTITANAAGLYWVQVNNGCVNRDSINIAYNSPPAAFTLGNDTSYCGSFSRVLTTGNASTVWSTNTTAAQITVSAPGTYWASETNACGVASDTIVFTQTLPAHINLGNDTTLCPAQTLTLNASYPSSTYLWSNNSTASSIVVSSAGLYWVQVNNGCTARDSITVSYASPPANFSLGNDTAYCSAFTRVLSTGNASTVWSTAATGGQITINSPGTYWATESNQCGSASDTIVISQGSAPVVSLGADTAICSSQAVTLDAGNAGATYNWSNNTNNESVTTSTPGTYSVTVTSAAACTGTGSVIISSYSVPLSITSANTSCGTSNGSVTTTITNGRSPYQYHWNTNATSSDLANLPSGSYDVTVTDATGCTASASASVAASGSNSVSVTASSNIICPNDTATLCATAGFAAYSWSNSDTSQCISTSLAGGYSVTVTDVGNCTASSGVTNIQVRQPPTVTVSVNGDTLTSYSASTYQWYLNDTLIPGATAGTYVAQVSGNYTVVISDSHGCTATSSVVHVNVLGIGHVLPAGDVQVYPNPSEDGNWILEVDANVLGGTVELYDDNGRVIYRAIVSNIKTELNLNAARGIYLLRLTAKDNYFTTRLVKL